jgi:hypothetical protein
MNLSGEYKIRVFAGIPNKSANVICGGNLTIFRSRRAEESISLSAVSTSVINHVISNSAESFYLWKLLLLYKSDPTADRGGLPCRGLIYVHILHNPGEYLKSRVLN